LLNLKGKIKTPGKRIGKYFEMIILKSESEISCIRKSSQIVVEALKELQRFLAPGITTGELNEIAEKFISKKGGLPSFKGYRGYPYSICTSINEEVVHGFPGKRKLERGEIISLDLGVKLQGYHGDAALTLPVGKINAEIQKLLKISKEALYKGIEQARVGKRLFDISYAIQSHAEGNGFSVVRDFVGHGIGKELHEDPQIPNFGEPHKGPRLEAGMVLAIEPMVNMGSYEVKVLEDNWTVVTRDRRPSAHFEHMVVITDHKPEILTAAWDM
jgi:methionyl aminopeptidase